MDMTQFILARNRSSPQVLSSGSPQESLEYKNQLSRCEEVEDIPNQMIQLKPQTREFQPRNIHHSQSATVRDHGTAADEGHTAAALGLSVADSDHTAAVAQLQSSDDSELNLTAAAAAAALEQRSPRSPPRSPYSLERPVFYVENNNNSNEQMTRSTSSIEYRLPQQPPPNSSLHAHNSSLHATNSSLHAPHSPHSLHHSPLPSPNSPHSPNSPFSPNSPNSPHSPVSRRPQVAADESPDTGGLTTVTYTSSGSIASSRASEHDRQRKKIKPGRAYYIAKELVMTERTYVKDLSVVSVWFRNAVSQTGVPGNPGVTESLLESFDGLYEFHCRFLKQLEQRLSLWEMEETSGVVNQEQCRMGDLILDNLIVLQRYEDYMNDAESLLKSLDSGCKDDRMFEQLYREFEMQKVCYLPLNTFLLKPLHRLLHYHLILDRFLQLYPNTHPDVVDLLSASNQLNSLIKLFTGQLPYLDNLQKLIELQQDLVGLNNLLQPNREFIREGCLQKLSRKGYQQRMFFLFSDVLLYTSRLATQSLLFRVHGQLPIAGMTVEETDNKIAVSNSFAVYSGQRCLLVAASSESEKAKWMEDLQRAILMAGENKTSNDTNKHTERAVLYPSLKSNNSSEATDDEQLNLSAIDRGQILHRTNTLMHVCWHRNTSVSMRERSVANKGSFVTSLVGHFLGKLLSGFLLRKFKTNNDWQRLWVVFTNFCLFFYKSYRDDFPLASLPLLGYSIQVPSATDNIREELCFKLQFKNHVYFFRAESPYTFERWMEVISSATLASHHMRLFSRLDSEASAQSQHNSRQPDIF